MNNNLRTEERIEKLERRVYNIMTCDNCKQDYGGSPVSTHYNINKMRVCFLCYEELDKIRYSGQL